MNRAASRILSLRSRPSRLAEASAAALLAMTILISLGAVLESSGVPGAPDLPGVDAASGPHLIATASGIDSLPTSGMAWLNMKAAADSSATPNLSDQNSNADVIVLAKALVYARTNVLTYRNQVLDALKAVVGTEAGGRTLAAGRGVPAYVIAADLISLSSTDPAFDSGTFRPWLRRLLTENLQGMTLISTQENRPNNWGTHAGAARAAIAIYLGDTAQLARTAQVFKGWLGDRASYAGFKWGDLSWQCDPSSPVGVDPTGCTKSGVLIDGALPDDMRRGGSFQWPPAQTGYAWEAMQGAVLEAELLQRAGYDAWSWGNDALLRATKFLYRAGWPATSDDTWQPWLIDYRYGTSFRTSGRTHPGKNFGWTDWLYGQRVSGSAGGGLAGVSSGGSTGGPSPTTSVAAKGTARWLPFNDSSSLVAYYGTWARTRSQWATGHTVRVSRRAHSRAVLKLYGNGVAWYAPTGPTEGRAAVYVDGRLVKIVNLHATRRHDQVNVFVYKWKKVGMHYLSIINLGTSGHPAVVIDGFLVHR